MFYITIIFIIFILIQLYFKPKNILSPYMTLLIILYFSLLGIISMIYDMFYYLSKKGLEFIKEMEDLKEYSKLDIEDIKKDINKDV